MPAPAPELISFAAFCDELRKLPAQIRRAFETDIRLSGVTFTYRTATEWDRQFQMFTQADRRRRNHG